MSKKKLSSDKQIQQITKILLLWPTCPTSSIKKYIEDTLGTIPTRACIQEAKRLLDLHEPEYTETTKAKKKFVEAYVTVLSCVAGIHSYTEGALVVKTEKELKKLFKQRTNRTLLVSWIRETVGGLDPMLPHSEQLSLLEAAKAELESMSIRIDTSRQVEIL